MPSLTRIRSFFLFHLSQPRNNRAIYRAIRRQGVQSILEIGVDDAARSERLIEVLADSVAPEQIRFTGIDLFELRPDGQPKIALKQAFCTLRQSGAKVRLLPGDPHLALARAANGLGPQDVVLVSASVDAESMARAWFFVPRILHPSSQIWVEEPGAKESEFRRYTCDEVEQLANRAGVLRRAA